MSIKDLGKSLAHTLTVTQDYFFLEKKSDKCQNLLNNDAITLYFFTWTHINKRAMNSNSKVTRLDFTILFCNMK